MNEWTVMACLMVAVAPTQSLAKADQAQTTEIRMRYSYRELASAESARHLLRRIGNAALESCGASSFSLAEVKSATRASACWRDAVGGAVRRIGDPVLTAAAHEGRF
jgi:UrcA family protein